MITNKGYLTQGKEIVLYGENCIVLERKSMREMTFKAIRTQKSQFSQIHTHIPVKGIFSTYIFSLNKCSRFKGHF